MRSRVPFGTAPGRAVRRWSGAAALAALVGCRLTPIAVDTVTVRLLAEGTTWQAAYLVPESNGHTAEVPTGREIHMPLGASVRLILTSRTYISDFALPELGLRDFAAPDLPSAIEFRADRTGRYTLRGDELCGLPHTEANRGWLIVEEASGFRTWVDHRRQGRQR